MFDNMGVSGAVEARRQLAEIKLELEGIDSQVVDAVKSKPWDERRVEQTVNELIGQLRQTADVLRTLPMPTLRRMLDVLVEKLDVDLATGAVEVTFGLPEWAIQAPQRLGYELCLKA